MFVRPWKILVSILALASASALWQQAQLQVLALSRIDPVPETRQLVESGRYAEAADHLDYFMRYDYVRQDPEAVALQERITQVRDSLGYRADKLSEGLLTGSSDETIGQVAGVATDFLVIGDLRDLSHQAVELSRGGEVDEVVTALATIGLVASATQIASTAGTAATAGATAPATVAATTVKTGVSLLKAARKAGKLPSWLGRTIVDGARSVKQTGRLDALNQLFGDLYQLARTRGGLTLLSHTQDAASLSRMARFAATFGERSATLFRIGGEAALRMTQRADELGVSAIESAATYGQAGLRLLDDLGAIRFVKYSARAARVAYKGEVFQWLARWLLSLPTWLLAAITALGVLVWIPGRRVAHRVQGAPAVTGV